MNSYSELSTMSPDALVIKFEQTYSKLSVAAPKFDKESMIFLLELIHDVLSGSFALSDELVAIVRQFPVKNNFIRCVNRIVLGMPRFPTDVILENYDGVIRAGIVLLNPNFLERPGDMRISMKHDHNVGTECGNGARYKLHVIPGAGRVDPSFDNCCKAYEELLSMNPEWIGLFGNNMASMLRGYIAGKFDVGRDTIDWLRQQPDSGPYPDMVSTMMKCVKEILIGGSEPIDPLLTYNKYAHQQYLIQTYDVLGTMTIGILSLPTRISEYPGNGVRYRLRRA